MRADFRFAVTVLVWTVLFAAAAVGTLVWASPAFVHTSDGAVLGGLLTGGGGAFAGQIAGSLVALRRYDGDLEAHEKRRCHARG